MLITCLYEFLNGIHIVEYDLLNAIVSRTLHGRMIPKQSEEYLGIGKRSKARRRLHIQMEEKWLLRVANLNDRSIHELYAYFWRI